MSEKIRIFYFLRQAPPLADRSVLKQKKSYTFWLNRKERFVFPFVLYGAFLFFPTLGICENMGGFFTFFPGPRVEFPDPPTPQTNQELEKAIFAYKKQDYSTALHFFEKASNAGNLVASWHLGNMYRRGVGVAADLKKALKYYGILVERYTEDQSDKMLLKITIDSFVQMADIYRYGTSQDPHIQNLRKALDFYSIAASYGHPSAFYGLGLLYRTSPSLEKQRKQALFWFKKAAYKHYIPAQILLGDLYSSGKIIPKSRVQALFWYNIASQNFLSKQNNMILKKIDKIYAEMSEEEKQQLKLLLEKYQKTGFF